MAEEKTFNELLKEKQLLINIINNNGDRVKKVLKKVTKNFIVVWSNEDKPSTTNYHRERGWVVNGDSGYFSHSIISSSILFNPNFTFLAIYSCRNKPD